MKKPQFVLINKYLKDQNIISSHEKEFLGNEFIRRMESPPPHSQANEETPQNDLSKRYHNFGGNTSLNPAEKEKEMKEIEINEKTSFNGIEKQKSIHSSFSSMPPCIEKSLLALHYYLVEESLNPGTYAKEIEKEYGDIEGYIKDDYDLEKHKTYLQNILSNIESKNFIKAKSNLKEILKAVIPFNIYKLMFLVKKAEESGKIIEDHDIILLIGDTGAGKVCYYLFIYL